MPLIVHDCPHCAATSVAFKCISISQRNGKDDIATVTSICPICSKPVGFWIKKVRATHHSLFSSLVNFHGSVEEAGWEIDRFWPPALSIECPDSVPPAIARNFIQAEHAARAGHLESAGMTYRRVLELAMKDKLPAGKGTLAKRIDELAQAGGLTPEMKTWAHTVRELGNESVHDESEPAQKDIDDLASFTEVLLEYLYTLPAKVSARTPTPSPAKPAP